MGVYMTPASPATAAAMPNMIKPAIGVNGFETRFFGETGPCKATIPAPRETCYLQTLEQDGTLSDPVLADEPAGAQKPAATPIGAAAQITASRIGQDHPRPAPMYMRNADAAPAKDPPPKILT